MTTRSFVQVHLRGWVLQPWVVAKAVWSCFEVKSWIMIKKSMHRWKAKVKPNWLGYVPTPTPYVTFCYRGVSMSPPHWLSEEWVRKNRNNIATDLQFYMNSHVLPPFDSRKNGLAATFRGGSMAPSPPLENINYKTKTIRDRISFFWLHNQIITPPPLIV